MSEDVRDVRERAGRYICPGCGERYHRLEDCADCARNHQPQQDPTLTLDKSTNGRRWSQ